MLEAPDLSEDLAELDDAMKNFLTDESESVVVL